MFSRPAAAPEPRPTVARKAPPTLPEPTNTTQKLDSDTHASESTAAVEGAAAGSTTESKSEDTEVDSTVAKTENAPEAEAANTEPEAEAANTEPEAEAPETNDS